MKRKRVLLSVGGLSLFLVLLVMSVPLVAAGAEKTQPQILTIGCLAGLTGFASPAERITAQGYQLGADYINDKGGITIKGQKYLIKLVMEDHKCTAEGAANAATKLLFDHKVKFVAGGVMPFTIIAANSVLGPAKVLFATNYNCATPQEYGPTTPYQFVTTNATVEGMASMLEYVAQARPEVKTIAVILPEDGSAAILFPMVIQMAKARGMTVSGDAITFAMDAVDFTPIAKKAMGRNPDAIFMGNGWPSMQGSILKTARQSGYTKLIFQTNYAAADAILKVAGPEASTNFFLHSVTPGERTNPPLMEEVFRRTKAKYGHEEIMFTHKGFDNIYILAQAIEAAQSLDPTDVKNKWEKMDKIVGSTGTGRMCGQKTYGINHSVCLPDPIAGLVNGQVKHLKWMNVIMTP